MQSLPIARVVRTLRAASQTYGLTQWEVAQESQVCEATVSNLFSGKTRFPRWQTIASIGWTLGFTIELGERKGFKLKSRVA